MKRTFLIFMTAFLMLVTTFAQGVKVDATTDVQTIRLGDWIRYSITITAPDKFLLTLPVLKDTIGSFDVVQQDSILRTENNGTTTYTKNFIITKFDSGMHFIPAYGVHYFDAGGTQQIARSNEIPIAVQGIDVDTTQSIRDVKPQLTVPLSAEEIALYIALVLALAAAIYGIYYYIRKRRMNAGMKSEDQQPVIPAHVLALLQLEELESKGLWQRGELKLFYSEATEIVRRYFERRYGIMALEMTSGEVMAQLEKFEMEKETSVSIHDFLTGADLVKFAKYQPVASENENVIPEARLIVERTMPESIEPPTDRRQETAQ